jgi:hypothetical protein
MGSKATILVKYFETSTTPFPTVCPANEVPAVLEWEKFYVFQQNAPM